MAYSFGVETPVLWMDPRPPPAAPAQRLLLWPAWAYVVIAPRVGARPDDELDVFQQTILRLFKAGVRDAFEISGLLHLDRRLIAYIATGLRELHLCEDDGTLTPRGERALQDSTPETGEPCVGHVFQEPSSLKLWRRFVEELPLREVDWPGGRPQPRIGTTGGPVSRWALAVQPPDGAAPVTPSPAMVLEAIEWHQRAIVRAEGSGPVAVRPERVDRVTVVSEAPRPVWLGTVLYVADPDDEAAAWNVMDPFGLGTSPFLRTEIDRRRRTLPELSGALSELLAPDAGDDRSAAYRRRAEAARLEMDQLFDPMLQTHRELREPLVDLALALERTRQEQRPAGRADVLVRAQRVLEATLALGLPSSGDDRVAVDLSGSRDYDAELLGKWATNAGFAGLPRRMRLVPASRIRAALRRRTGSLRPLALANLACAASDPRHCLHEAARQHPTLLEELDELAGLRDASAHAGGRPPEQDQLEALVDQTQNVVMVLLLAISEPTPTGSVHVE